MGYMCFKCGHLIDGDTNALVWHLKNIHSLVSGRFFKQSIICSQDGCSRTFKNHVATFKVHLRSKHTQLPVANFNDAPQRHDNLGDDDGIDDEQDHASDSDDEHEVAMGGNEDVDQNNEVWDNFNKAEIEQRVAIFLSQLLASCSVVKSTIDDVVDQTSDLMEDIVSYLKHKTCAFAEENMIPVENNSFRSLMENFENCEKPFAKFKGDYLRRKYFLQSGTFLEPKEIPIGLAFYQRNNRNTGNVYQAMKNISFQYVPVKPLMKLILESTGYMDSIHKHTPSEDGLMYDFHDGKYCKQSEFFQCPNNIKLLLYIDDFEVTNPLSPKAGTHKLGAVYCTVTNLQPQFRSLLNNCYLLMLFTAADAKLYGYEPIFEPLISDLNSLIRDGIEINTPIYQGIVRIGIAQVTGDNLGIHSLFGFAEGFTANYPCRICKLHRTEAQVAVNERRDMLRTKENYQIDLNAEDLPTTGVKTDCPLNRVLHFHVIDNFAPDIMHDLLEGVCPLELKLVLKALIDKEYFDLNLLNSRLVSYNYGSGDSSNKPCIISASALTHPDGAPGQNAAQVWCLLRHIPLIIGDMVPEDDEHWEILLMLLQCMNIIFSPVVSEAGTFYLKQLIEDHHRHFLALFGHERHLKPKHHHMTHYPRAMRQIGPLVRFWAMRFEAKHNFSRRLSHIVCNFKNIAKTLAYRNQMLLCFNLLSKKNLVGKEVEVGPGSTALLTSVDDADFLARRLGIAMYDEVYLPNWCKVYGHVYKKHQFVAIGKDTDLDPVFGKIVNIIAMDQIVRLVYNEWTTTGISRHFHAFEVEPKLPRKVGITSVDDLVDFNPLQANQSANPDNSKFYIVAMYKF